MQTKTKLCIIILILLTISSIFLLTGRSKIAPWHKGYKGTIALINGTLIDGTGKEPLKNSVVIVKENKITSVGKVGTIKIPKEAKVINIKGKTILPGIINAHAHVFYFHIKDGYPQYSLENWAKSGVTTILDLAYGEDARIYSHVKSLMKKPESTRLLTSGPMLTEPQGYPVAKWEAESGFIELKSTEHAQKTVENLIKAGAPVIKFSREGGAVWQDVFPVMDDDKLKAIVETAHKYNKKVAAHVLWSSDLEKVLDAKVDIIAHMINNLLTDDLIERMVEKNVYITPTIEVFYQATFAFTAKPRKSPYLKNIINNLRKFHAAGGKVALGTDFFGNGHDKNIQFGMPTVEMGFYLEAGMSPMEVIVSATKNAAYVCGMEDTLGTIEKGKIADIIVSNENPLENINALKDLYTVIHNGVIIN